MALLRFTAVASPFFAFSALRAVKLENAGVVVLDDTTDVGHAAVAHLDGITVENLPHPGSGWEMPADQAEEPLADVGLHILALKGLETKDFFPLLSRTFFGCCWSLAVHRMSRVSPLFLGLSL